MSPESSPLSTSSPIGGSAAAGSLRDELEKRRAAGSTFNVREIIAFGVPLCTHLAELHNAGGRLFVYPSIIAYGHKGPKIMRERMHAAPVLSRDRACLAPEERKGA